MNNKQLAAHLGLSPNTTKKFSPEKRQQLIAEAQQGINPQLAQLIGELAVACYKATMRVGDNVLFDYWLCPTDMSFSWFNVHYRKKGDDQLTYVVESRTDLNCINVAGAISLVEAL
jgi:hypothetical protein